MNVFIAMSTQWRIGNNGATGLDYNALKPVMEFVKVRDQQQVFEDIRIMEDVALSVIRESKK